MAPFPPEQYVGDCPPKVPPIRAEWMLQVGFRVAAFRLLHLFDGAGSLLVIVERWQQTGLCLCAQCLHLRGVEREIVLRQRSYPNQLHIALQHVENHRQFVKPHLAEQLAPDVHSIVISKFSSFLQGVMLVYVRLEIFGIGIHGAELVNPNQLAVFSHTSQLDERCACRLVVPNRCLDFTGKDEELAVAKLFIYHLEACAIHPSEDFHPVVRAVLPFGHGEIDFFQPRHLRTETVPQVVKKVYRPVQT